MFIGHFAVGFAAKRLAPAISLGTLFLAVQLADLIWPTLVLLGVEQVEIEPGITAVTPLDFVYYPYSHSLLTMAGWGVLLGAGYFVVRKARVYEGLLLALAVLSHWVLDVITHRPDMPYGFNGGDRAGLGLWNSLPGTLVVELALLALGVALYARATVSRDRVGRWGFRALVAFLLVVYLANLFGPPPPSVAAVALAGHALWLLVLWGYWLDRHRQARVALGPG